MLVGSLSGLEDTSTTQVTVPVEPGTTATVDAESQVKPGVGSILLLSDEGV